MSLSPPPPSSSLILLILTYLPFHSGPLHHLLLCVLVRSFFDVPLPYEVQVTKVGLGVCVLALQETNRAHSRAVCWHAQIFVWPPRGRGHGHAVLFRLRCSSSLRLDLASSCRLQSWALGGCDRVAYGAACNNEHAREMLLWVAQKFAGLDSVRSRSQLPRSQKSTIW